MIADSKFFLFGKKFHIYDEKDQYLGEKWLSIPEIKLYVQDCENNLIELGQIQLDSGFDGYFFIDQTKMTQLPKAFCRGETKYSNANNKDLKAKIFNLVDFVIKDGTTEKILSLISIPTIFSPENPTSGVYCLMGLAAMQQMSLKFSEDLLQVFMKKRFDLSLVPPEEEKKEEIEVNVQQLLVAEPIKPKQYYIHELKKAEKKDKCLIF